MAPQRREFKTERDAGCDEYGAVPEPEWSNDAIVTADTTVVARQVDEHAAASGAVTDD
jgi:hypothetical protein